MVISLVYGVLIQVDVFCQRTPLESFGIFWNHLDSLKSSETFLKIS